DGGGLVARRPTGHHRPVEFGHEQRRARSWYCRYARKPPVARFTQFEHIDDTLTAGHTDTAALAIDEHIIGITAGLDLGHDMPVLARERHQCRRATTTRCPSLSIAMGKFDTAPCVGNDCVEPVARSAATISCPPGT